MHGVVGLVPLAPIFADKRGVAAAVAADGELGGLDAHFARRARSAMTNVELLQQLPPRFCWPVRGWIEKSRPDIKPGCVGAAHGAHCLFRTCPPYDRQ